jgi:type I restriction enzyme R subunit
MPKKNPYTEHGLVHQPTVQALENMGWQSVFVQENEGLGVGSVLGRSHEGEVVLTEAVLAALKRLNPSLPDIAYTQALEKVLQHDPSLSLLAQNQAKSLLLREGVLVSYRDAAGRKIDQRLRLIDFQQVHNNHFLAVNELWVQGSLWKRRPDLIGYVNGLPLVFVELKAVNIPITDAYKKNYQDYLDTIPRLFDWNALVLISNGVDAQYGALGQSLAQFSRWKRKDEDDPEPQPEQPLLPLLLEGLLDKSRLLDLIENFFLFDTSQGGLKKIVARNHQVLGVNRVIARLQSTDPAVQAEVQRGHLGVFWHTQGSGKSYSMVFLTEKIHRKLSAAYTFVIITDRNELDTQIATTYTTSGRANSQSDQAHSGEALRALLREQNRRYVFSLIQKFQQSVKTPYSERADIIVISDEAHRSQYGRLAQNLRKGLPKAKFLGFTGTPLIDKDEAQLTREVFGEYVSVYDFQRAVADGATLPLFYENRGEKLAVIDPDLNQRVLAYIESIKQAEVGAETGAETGAKTEVWSEDKEAKLYRALARDYAILTSPTRLKAVAQDFVEHFHQRWRIVTPGGGKAMLVCLDKLTCVKMHDVITTLWQQKIQALDTAVTAEERRFIEAGKPFNASLQARRAHIDWMQATECCVVVSQEQGEVADFAHANNPFGEALSIQPHREKMVKRKLEQAFKDPEHPFRIVIVCAMWLTGFDVPSLATLYLDKPMQGHTLMQAIARVNRVSGGKKQGMIIDYNGMLDSLRRALAIFAQGDRSSSDTNPVRDDREALNDYAASLTAAQSYLQTLDFDLNTLINAEGFAKTQKILEAVNILCASTESHKRFQVLVEDSQARWRALFPHPGLHAFDAQEQALHALHQKLLALHDSPDIHALLHDLYEVVDTSVAIQPSKEAQPAVYSLSKIDIDRLRSEFEKSPYKQVIALTVQEKIEQRLQNMVKTNPSRIDLYQRYQDIVLGYNQNKDQSEIQKVMDDLFDFHHTLDREQRRYLHEGLDSEAHLAVFDLLQKDTLTKAEREAIKQVAKSLLHTLTDQRFALDRLRRMATVQAQMKAEITRHLYTHLPAGAYTDIHARADGVFRHFLQ